MPYTDLFFTNYLYRLGRNINNTDYRETLSNALKKNTI